jgi:predicted HicB family RNase H-like nuclease
VETPQNTRLDDALELARILKEDRRRKGKPGRPGGGSAGVLMVRIRKEILEHLKTQAKIAGVTQREIVERALCRYLGREE